MNALIFVFLIGFLAYSANGCRCALSTQKQVWDRSDIVTKMNIVSKETNGTKLVYMANYLDIYKPANQSHIFIPVPVVTQSSSAACGATGLKVGRNYLISATYDANRTMTINSCNGMPADGQTVSKPPGALLWKYVTPQLLNKLETGNF